MGKEKHSTNKKEDFYHGYKSEKEMINAQWWPFRCVQSAMTPFGQERKRWKIVFGRVVGEVQTEERFWGTILSMMYVSAGIFFKGSIDQAPYQGESR